MGSYGVVPHYLHVYCFAVYALTRSVLSDAPISAQKDIDNPGLDLSRMNIVAAFHHIYNASCDTGDSLQYH